MLISKVRRNIGKQLCCLHEVICLRYQMHFLTMGNANLFAANVRVFAKAGNSLFVQPGTNAQLKTHKVEDNN